MKKTILITGVLGFIFSNFIRKVIKEYPQYRFVGIDNAVKEYNLDNAFEHPNYKFYFCDIADSHVLNRIFTVEKPNIVIGGAAESFVDNSISDVMPFIRTNVIGTQTLINACLNHNVEQYLHISTDEVYGQQFSMQDKPWAEDSPIGARNPYAASKAAAELIVMSSHLTHGLQYKMTRSCNVYGPRQKKENLVPMIIASLANDAPIRIHGDGLNWRQYIRVNDKISAIMTILEKGEMNNVYNIGDNNYFTNLEMVENIAKIMKKRPIIQFMENRKAHDLGYSVDSNKLRELGWFPKYNFNTNLTDCIKWYMANK